MLLADHAAKPHFQPVFEFGDGFGTGSSDRGHTPDDLELLVRFESSEDFRGVAAGHVTEQQRDRLRVLVTDELQQGLRVDLFDKAERHRLDLLLQVADQLAWRHDRVLL